MQTPNAIIVFDLDGTLVDSAGDLCNALNVGLDHFGIPPVTLGQTREFVGKGARAMINKAVAEHCVALGRPEPSEDDFQKMHSAFLDHYRVNLSVETDLFPGAATAMDELEALGFGLAVCTNKTEVFARQLLEELELTHRFRSLIGGDTLAHSKPHPLPLLTAIEQAGGQPATAVMVGDSIADIGAALSAKVSSIAVRFGYSDTPVDELGADIVIDHFDSLVSACVDLQERQSA